MQSDRDILLIGYTSEIHLVLIGSEIEAGIRPEDGAAYRSGSAADAGAGDAGQIVREAEDQGVIAGATPAFHSTRSGERQTNIEERRSSNATMSHAGDDADQLQGRANVNDLLKARNGVREYRNTVVATRKRRHRAERLGRT